MATSDLTSVAYIYKQLYGVKMAETCFKTAAHLVYGVPYDQAYKYCKCSGCKEVEMPKDITVYATAKVQNVLDADVGDEDAALLQLKEMLQELNEKASKNKKFAKGEYRFTLTWGLL